MTTIRKFVFAGLLAAIASCFAPKPAFAQETAQGHFTLTHEVLWGTAKIPAGEYAFSFDPDNITPVLTLSKMSGPRAGFMILVPGADRSKGVAGNRLLLASAPEGSYVTALELPQFGMTLHFPTPSRVAERQIAKASPANSGPAQ